MYFITYVEFLLEKMKLVTMFVAFQELDYLLKPELWPNPYVIDAK